MNEPYRLRYANQIVGAFALLIVVIVLVLAAFLLRAQNYFAAQDSFWIVMNQEELSGIRPGTEVTMLGRRVGSVKQVEYLSDDDRVKVTLAINADQSSLIFNDSFVVQDRKFGLGTPVIDIRRSTANRGGDAERSTLMPGSQISMPPGESDSFEKMAIEVASANQAIQKAQAQFNPTLVEIQSAASDFRDSIGDQINPAFEQSEVAAKTLQEASLAFQQASENINQQASETLQSIQRASEQLETQTTQLTRQIQTLINEDIRQSVAQVGQASNDVGDTAKQIQQTSQEVGLNIDATLQTLQKAADSVQQLAEETRQIVRIVRGEADDLPGTTARINDTISQTQDLVEEVRGHWLLRRSSKKTVPAIPVSPSSIRGGYAR